MPKAAADQAGQRRRGLSATSPAVPANRSTQPPCTTERASEARSVYDRSLGCDALLIVRVPVARSLLALFADRTRPEPGDRVSLNVSDVHGYFFLVLAFADLLAVLAGPEFTLDEDVLALLQ